MRALLASCALAAVSGCAPSTSPATNDAALCAEAIAHVESCLGEPPVIDVCDAGAASQLLAMSCDELEDAKADGFFAAILCFFGFDSYCDAPETRTLIGSVQRLDTASGAADLIVRLRRGDELVRTTVTASTGAFAFGDLEPTTYVIEVYYGVVPLRHVTIDLAERTSIIVYVPFIPR